MIWFIWSMAVVALLAAMVSIHFAADASRSARRAKAARDD